MRVIIFMIWLSVTTMLNSRVDGISSTKILLEPLEVCKRIKKSPKKVLAICKQKIDKNESSTKNQLIGRISAGISLGFKECENQFRNRRWNCTTNKRVMRRTLLRDTRETAFVHSITAAAITYSIATACSSGMLFECSCDKSVPYVNTIITDESRKRVKKKSHMPGDLLRSTNNTTTSSKIKNWEWRGCDDNIHFGNRKSKDFLGLAGHHNDIKTVVKIHNNNAGRIAIRKSMRIDCKCHGLSGSCTTKTCWMKLPPFGEIGSRLRDKYDIAMKVASNDGTTFMSDQNKPPTKRSLMYTDESPNYCVQNNKTGVLGVKGRECEISSKHEDGCKQLCCNGYTRTKVVTKKNCDCKFIWCCDVVCNECEFMREIGICD